MKDGPGPSQLRKLRDLSRGRNPEASSPRGRLEGAAGGPAQWAPLDDADPRAARKEIDPLVDLSRDVSQRVHSYGLLNNGLFATSFFLRGGRHEPPNPYARLGPDGKPNPSVTKKRDGPEGARDTTILSLQRDWRLLHEYASSLCAGTGDRLDIFIDMLRRTNKWGLLGDQEIGGPKWGEMADGSPWHVAVLKSVIASIHYTEIQNLIYWTGLDTRSMYYLITNNYLHFARLHSRDGPEEGRPLAEMTPQERKRKNDAIYSGRKLTREMYERLDSDEKAKDVYAQAAGRRAYCLEVKFGGWRPFLTRVHTPAEEEDPEFVLYDANTPDLTHAVYNDQFAWLQILPTNMTIVSVAKREMGDRIFEDRPIQYAIQYRRDTSKLVTGGDAIYNAGVILTPSSPAAKDAGFNRLFWPKEAIPKVETTEMRRSLLSYTDMVVYRRIYGSWEPNPLPETGTSRRSPYMMHYRDFDKYPCEGDPYAAMACARLLTLSNMAPVIDGMGVMGMERLLQSWPEGKKSALANEIIYATDGPDADLNQFKYGTCADAIESVTFHSIPWETESAWVPLVPGLSTPSLPEALAWQPGWYESPQAGGALVYTGPTKAGSRKWQSRMDKVAPFVRTTAFAGRCFYTEGDAPNPPDTVVSKLQEVLAADIDELRRVPADEGHFLAALDGGPTPRNPFPALVLGYGRAIKYLENVIDGVRQRAAIRSALQYNARLEFQYNDAHAKVAAAAQKLAHTQELLAEVRANYARFKRQDDKATIDGLEKLETARKAALEGARGELEDVSGSSRQRMAVPKLIPPEGTPVLIMGKYKDSPATMECTKCKRRI